MTRIMGDVNVSYYDVLGVPADASRDEIRVAWRDAAQRFEPGSGGSSAQFRLFNEAAEVLLDPERRREYDARLGVAAEPTESADQAGPAEPAGPAAAQPEERRSTRTGGGWVSRGIPLVALVLLGVVTLAAVAGAAYLWNRASEAEAIELARSRAPATAERAAAAILSYHHESLEADKDKAVRFMTDRYEKEYVKTFESLVVENAKETRAQVEAQVVGSSVSRATPEQAQVLLFVNQTTKSTAHGGEPQTALNRVMLTMVEDDGSWLVDDITSY